MISGVSNGKIGRKQEWQFAWSSLCWREPLVWTISFWLWLGNMILRRIEEEQKESLVETEGLRWEGWGIWSAYGVTNHLRMRLPETVFWVGFKRWKLCIWDFFFKHWNQYKLLQQRCQFFGCCFPPPNCPKEKVEHPIFLQVRRIQSESSYIWVVHFGCPRDRDVCVIYCLK